jgi:hypothetical protein
MKVTAVLRAVGYVPISETSPSRPAPTSIGGVPTLCTMTSRPPGMLGGVVVAGRSRAIGRPENARPLAGWLAAHPAS